MSSLALWNQLVDRAKTGEFEIHTVPQNKREPVWFRVSSDGSTLFIKQAVINSPSSQLKMPRMITFDGFDRVYGYYDLRLKGTAISQEAAGKSVNTVYIYGLIADARSNQR